MGKQVLNSEEEYIEFCKENRLYTLDGFTRIILNENVQYSDCDYHHNTRYGDTYIEYKPVKYPCTICWEYNEQPCIDEIRIEFIYQDGLNG